MPLSKLQTSLYWRTWASVCVFMGWKNSDSKHRYALHQEAGCPKSMTAFGNKQLDAYLKYCSSLTRDKKYRDAEREKMIWRIRKDASDANFSEQYLEKLSRDLTGLGCWEELSKDDLENFRNTVHNRAYAKAPKEVDFIPGTRKFLKPDFDSNREPALQATCSDNEPY